MKAKDHRFTTVLTHEEYAAVKLEADEQGRSVRRQVQYIIRRWIKAKENSQWTKIPVM